MKQTTKEILQQGLESGLYAYDVEKSNYSMLSRLYVKYLEEEVDSVDRLIHMVSTENENYRELTDFLLSNAESFKISKEILELRHETNPTKVLERDIIKTVFQYRIYQMALKNAQKFVNITSGVITGSRLLEVGSGAQMPISTLLFSKTFQGMGTMDKFSTYWSSRKMFQNLGINTINEYFDNNTDINQYDILVGSAPCSAITPMVEQCAKKENSDKEYFIQMCSCYSPRNGLTGFVEYLKEKDNRLKCFVFRPSYEDIIKKEFFIANDEELYEWDNVYITNSSKHQDDIMSVIHDNFTTQEKVIEQ